MGFVLCSFPCKKARPPLDFCFLTLKGRVHVWSVEAPVLAHTRVTAWHDGRKPCLPRCCSAVWAAYLVVPAHAGEFFPAHAANMPPQALARPGKPRPRNLTSRNAARSCRRTRQRWFCSGTARRSLSSSTTSAQASPLASRSASSGSGRRWPGLP